MRQVLTSSVRLLAAIVAATLLMFAPAFADDADNKVQLDKLFSELKTAPDAQTARSVELQIERIWVVPSDPDLAGRMAAVLVAEQSGDLPFALTLLNKMVGDHPAYAEAWNQRATVEYQLNQYDASLADIDKVLAIEPRHFGALSGRVLIYLAEGNRPEALKAMIAALAVHPFLATKQLFPELSVPKTQA